MKEPELFNTFNYKSLKLAKKKLIQVKKNGYKNSYIYRKKDRFYVIAED